MQVVATFRVGVACADCMARYNSDLAITAADDAPTTVDELVDSGALERMRFSCTRCDSAIGTIESVRRTYVQDCRAA